MINETLSNEYFGKKSCKQMFEELGDFVQMYATPNECLPNSIMFRGAIVDYYK